MQGELAYGEVEIKTEGEKKLDTGRKGHVTVIMDDFFQDRMVSGRFDYTLPSHPHLRAQRLESPDRSPPGSTSAIIHP